MLNPQILLGDRIRDTSVKVFKHIQDVFLGEVKRPDSVRERLRLTDFYTTSTLLSPFLCSLELLPDSHATQFSRNEILEILVLNIKRAIKPSGSFEFPTPTAKNSKLFTSSLCLLNLLKVYEENFDGCYHELRNGLKFLDKKISLIKPRANKLRADEALAAYTLLQASVVTKDKSHSSAGAGYFHHILSSNKAIAIGSESLLPNSIDEGLVTRILLDLYELSGKENFLFQAQNLCESSFLGQEKLLETLHSGASGRYFEKPINLTALSLSCYNWLRLYHLTKKGDLLDLAGLIMRFLSDVVDISVDSNILFPAWIKPQKHELSKVSCPLGARFYLDTSILGKEYFPVSVKQGETVARKVVPMLRVRA